MILTWRHPPRLVKHAMAEPLTAPSEQVPGIPRIELAGRSMNVDVARSGLWAVAGQVAVLSASFLATPFTIRLLGPAKYGLWALLGTVLTYVMIADLGMSDTSTTFAADSHGRGDDPGEAAAIWTALCVTLCLTGVVAVIVALAAPFLVSHLLHVRPDLHTQGVLALRLVCVAALATTFSTTINTPQQVRLRWRSLTLATSGPAILQVTLAPLVLLLLAGGVATMALLAAIAALVSAALNLATAMRLAPALRRVRASSQLLRPMIRYGVGMAVAGLALIPLTTAERLFLAHFHSSKILAYYSVAGTLGSLLLVVPVAVSRPLIPALVRLTAAGRTDEHRRLYEQSLVAVLLVLTPLIFVGAFVARPFLTVWAGSAYGDHSTVPFYLILAGLLFNGLSYVPTVQLIATRETSTLAILRVAEILPYLALAAVLSRAFGAAGAAAAWSARSIVDAVLLFAIVRRKHRLSWPPLRKRIRPSLLHLLLMAALLIAVALVTGSLAWRLAAGALALGLYCIGAWRFTLTAAERRRAAVHLARVVPTIRTPR